MLYINILVNSIIAVVFVSLNIWALRSGLEETFVSLAILFGFVSVVVNALFNIGKDKKRQL